MVFLNDVQNLAEFKARGRDKRKRHRPKNLNYRPRTRDKIKDAEIISKSISNVGRGVNSLTAISREARSWSKLAGIGKAKRQTFGGLVRGGRNITGLARDIKMLVR